LKLLLEKSLLQRASRKPRLLRLLPPKMNQSNQEELEESKLPLRLSQLSTLLLRLPMLLQLLKPLQQKNQLNSPMRRRLLRQMPT